MKENINKLMIIAGKLALGFFFFAIGTIMIINCKIGVAPWDVFHQGVANITGIAIGRAMIFSGIVVVTLAAILGQSLGWATLLNMYFIGSMVDLIIGYKIIPNFEADNLLVKLVIIIMGIVLQGLGTYFYISTGYGAGPRDGFMVALTKKTGRSFGLVKSSVDVTVVVIGYMMGGNLGIGTLIMAFGAGHIWQYMYNKIRFNISSIDHRFIGDDISYLKEKYLESKNPS